MRTPMPIAAICPLILPNSFRGHRLPSGEFRDLDQHHEEQGPAYGPMARFTGVEKEPDPAASTTSQFQIGEQREGAEVQFVSMSSDSDERDSSTC